MRIRPRAVTRAFAVLALVASHHVLAEELLTDQEVLGEPKASASPSGKVKKGQVTVLEKKGFWVRVKGGDVTGWTKLSNLKTESSGSLGLPDTGRNSGGNIVSTSGVRGLDGGDLVNAKPDTAEFGKLKSQAASKQQGSDFASAGGLATRSVNYIRTATK